MTRLSRAETQERNRAKVLTAARAEFTARGYRDAKIDEIADRASLTRGAVYSNFPSKRALYFAVLADSSMPPPDFPSLGDTRRSALGALARAWVARLETPEAQLGASLLAEVQASEQTRVPFTRLLALDALLLGVALERLEPPPPGTRLTRLATTAMTLLQGARSLSSAAPGLVEPFDVVSACEALATLNLNDWWPPPRVVPPTAVLDEPWSPPAFLDLVTDEPVAPGPDGVVAVLGLHRLPAAEEAIRAARAPVTVVMVTSEPLELAALARLVVTELAGCLRQAFPRSAWPAVRVVCDEGGVAAAAGVPSVSDGTEVAVRVSAGRLVGRAEGPGACHAAATMDLTETRDAKRASTRARTNDSDSRSDGES